MTETQPCIARFRTVSFGSASNNAKAAISICNIPGMGAGSIGCLPSVSTQALRSFTFPAHVHDGGPRTTIRSRLISDRFQAILLA